jgi:hypothetical protein
MFAGVFNRKVGECLHKDRKVFYSYPDSLFKERSQSLRNLVIPTKEESPRGDLQRLANLIAEILV